MSRRGSRKQKAGTGQVQKKAERRIHTYYRIEGGKLIRKNRKCPRCGAFMAHHKEPIERWTCGSCSYTEYATSR